MKTAKGTFPPIAALLLTISPLLGQSGLSTPMVGVAPGQTVRINALNLGTSQSTATTTCQITVQFLDQKAAVLKEKTLEISAAKSESIDFDRSGAQSEKRLELRAVIFFPRIGGAPPGPPVRRSFDCNLVPSLELYDTQTGRTSVILTDWKPLPTADPRTIALTLPAIPSRQIIIN